MSTGQIIAIILASVLVVILIGSLLAKNATPGTYKLYTINGNPPNDNLKGSLVTVTYDDPTGHLILTTKVPNKPDNKLTVESPWAAVLVGTNYKEDVNSTFYRSMITGRIKHISKNAAGTQFVSEYEKIDN